MSVQGSGVRLTAATVPDDPPRPADGPALLKETFHVCAISSEPDEVGNAEGSSATSMANLRTFFFGAEASVDAAKRLATGVSGRSTTFGTSLIGVTLAGRQIHRGVGGLDGNHSGL